MASFLEDALGVLGGGRTQVTASAVAAKAASKVGEVRNKLLVRFEEIGKKFGGSIGSDFFEALARGAAPAASDARAEESGRLFGAAVDPRQVAAQLPTIAAVVGIAAGLVILWKVFKR